MATPTNVNTTIAAGDALRVGVTSSPPPPPPPPPPAPAQSITLTALSGLSATAGGGGLNFSAQVANPTALPLNFAVETVSGPTASPTPSSSTWSLGDLNKAISAAWAAAGTSVIRVRDANNVTSNSLSVSVAAAPTPPPPAPSPATTATLSLSPTGTTGSSTTGTVTLNGPSPASGSITISGSGATITPGTLSWSSGEAGTAKSFTVQRASDGTTSVGITSGIAGVTVAGSPVSHTTSTGVVVSTGTPQPFTLTSSTSGALPFALGYAMAQGHVPSGQSLTFSGATCKLQVLSTWPDGSAKHGIIAGTYTSAGSAVTVTPTVGSASIGTPLSGASVQSAMASNTAVFDAGAFGSATFSGADFASPFRTHFATDAAAEFIYRKPFNNGADDAHLVAWIAVRLWASGAVEVLPWVENGYLNVASPTNKSATYTFTLGGTSRFSAVIDVKHHTRIPLLTGSVFSYWLASDPGVTFAHNTAYLIATKLVPNYGFGTPSTGTLNGLQQTYTPNTLAGISSSMGVAGSSTAIINNQQAHYITSGGDSRALAAAQVFGFSGGSWSTHYRDEATNLPLDLPDYPAITLQGGTPSIPAPSGGENGTAVTTHQPSFGYLPYLITGRWWFLEEAQFWTAYNFLSADAESRRGRVAFSTSPYLFANAGAGVIDPRAGTYAHRGGHWSIRTLAQTLAITPSAHPNFAGYQTVWENNTDFYHQTFVTGTHAPGWVSPMGMLGEYSAVNNTPISPNGSAAWWGNVWMSLFGTQAWGFASNLGLSQSGASSTRMLAVRNQSYKGVIDRAGDGLSSRPNWRRFTVFKFPWGTDGTGLPPDTTWTAAQGYAEYTSRWSLAALDPALGGSLKQHQGDGGSTDDDIVAGSSAATDYLPFGLSALAYAVEHRAAGALEGWRRLESASNWSTVTADLANNSGHGIKPALPSWLPPLGQFANISANTLIDVRPSGWPTNEIGGPFINWVGGQWAKNFGASGALVLHGSGHLTPGAPLWAGVWAFDINTLRWVGRNVPAAPLLETYPPNGYNTDFESTEPATLGHTYPPHTYDGLVYVPASVAGNTSGKLLKHFWPGTAFRNSVHAFDLDSTTSPPVRVIDDIAFLGASNNYPATAYDAARGGYWIVSGNGNGPMRFVNASTWGVTSYTGIGYNEYGDHSLVYIPSLDCLVGMGRANSENTAFTVYVCPIVAGTPQGFTLVTTTGTKPTDGRCGGQWSEWLGGIICYVGDGATSVQRLSPPTSGTLTGGTWTWQSQTLAGVGGVTPGRPGINTNNGQIYGGNGTWGRFVEVDWMPGVFLWASSITSAVQAWHVNKNGTWA